MSGGEGPSAGKVRAFARELAARLGPVPVRLCDERLSTVTAESQLRSQGRKGKKRRAVVDQAAAVVILQGALERERQTGDVRRRAGPARGHERVGRTTRARRRVRRRARLRRGRGVRRRAAAAASRPGLHPGASSCWSSSAAWPGSAAASCTTRSARVSARHRTTPVPARARCSTRSRSGATSVDIGRELKAKGVVKSVDAFNEAARDDEKSRNIQVGYYQLKKQMKAEDALERPRRPRQPDPEPGGGARGRPRAADREDHRRQDRHHPEGRHRGARQPQGHRPAGLGEGQPRGLPVPGDLHGAAEARTPSA